MNDNEAFDNFLLKYREVFTLTLDYYIPNGKEPPECYRDAIYEIWKIFYHGKLEWMAREPVMQTPPSQGELFPLENMVITTTPEAEETDTLSDKVR